MVLVGWVEARAYNIIQLTSTNIQGTKIYKLTAKDLFGKTDITVLVRNLTLCAQLYNYLHFCQLGGAHWALI